MSTNTTAGRVLKLSLSKFLQMRLNIFLFRFLPFSVSRWYLTALGKLYYLLNWREAALIRNTLSFVFRRRSNSQGLKEQINATFQGIFDHYHEKLFVAYSHFKRLLKFLKDRVRLAGEEDLQAALAAGKGALIVTGHFGAVEFLPGALALNGYPTSMICRFQTNRLRESLGRRAAHVGLELIDADDGNIFLAAIKALKQGRILITECDEFDEWRLAPGRQNYFLNCSIPSDRTLDILRKRSGAPVISALVKREGEKNYTLNLTPVMNGSAPLAWAGEECLKVLETAIEGSPEQWSQWKTFGKMIHTPLEVEDERQESGYLAPELGISVAD